YKRASIQPSIGGAGGNGLLRVPGQLLLDRRVNPLVRNSKPLVKHHLLASPLLPTADCRLPTTAKSTSSSETTKAKISPAPPLASWRSRIPTPCESPAARRSSCRKSWSRSSLAARLR